MIHIGKETVTFSIDSHLMEKLRQKEKSGNRSKIVEDLLENYVETESKDSVKGIERTVKDLKVQINENKNKIQELKAETSNYKNQISTLNKKKQELKKKKRNLQELDKFFEDQREKFESYRGDFEEFKKEYPGIYDLFDNKVNLDLEKSEFWNRFEDEINGTS